MVEETTNGIYKLAHKNKHQNWCGGLWPLPPFVGSYFDVCFVFKLVISIIYLFTIILSLEGDSFFYKAAYLTKLKTFTPYNGEIETCAKMMVR